MTWQQQVVNDLISDLLTWRQNHRSIGPADLAASPSVPHIGKKGTHHGLPGCVVRGARCCLAGGGGGSPPRPRPYKLGWQPDCQRTPLPHPGSPISLK
eukprot:1195793-Prorocentrum_minimum.AAC.3